MSKCSQQQRDVLTWWASLLGDQRLAQHLLGRLHSLVHRDDVHAALEAVLELAQASAARQDLALDDNLHHTGQCACMLMTELQVTAPFCTLVYCCYALWPGLHRSVWECRPLRGANLIVLVCHLLCCCLHLVY